MHRLLAVPALILLVTSAAAAPLAPAPDAGCTVTATLPAVAPSGFAYKLQWTGGAAPYEITEATKPDFSDGSTQSAPGTSAGPQHSVTSPTAYYYRVRTMNCNGAPGAYSPTMRIVVQPPPALDEKGGTIALVAGSPLPLNFTISVAGSGPFTATSSDPWLTVTPASGSLPVTLAATIRSAGLPPGTSTATVTVKSSLFTVAQIPVSVVSPPAVTPGAKTLPPAGALIIPVITHVNNGVATFSTDVRLTNATTGPQNYLLTYTPTHTDGTLGSFTTTIGANAGQTIALDDVASTVFGYGATGRADDQGFGALEIRPVASGGTTYASSRTFATTPTGTLGQYIPAVRFSTFVQHSTPIPTVVSLQQVQQSSTAHTNVGLVEGSGQPASGTLRFVSGAGALLGAARFTLKPGEQQQINSILAANGIDNLPDGRIELAVDSPTGAVTAYASIVDNVTQDPYAVAPVQASSVSATRFVLPGIAELTNAAASFHSDIRVYNGGTSPVTVTPTFYAQRSSTPLAPGVSAQPFTIAPGQVRAVNSVLPTLFNKTASAGMIVLTTPTPASIVATAKTYSSAPTGGTYGQFIPAITPAQGAGVGDRPLQILQIQQSPSFRSNIGLAELTGNAAHVKVTLIGPDSSTPLASREYDLEANEFRQLNSIVNDMLPETPVYNGRMTVEVTGGSGRVTAYASVVDNRTQDPTYVPAQ